MFICRAETYCQHLQHGGLWAVMAGCVWKEREQPRACGAGSRAPQIVARSLGCVLRCRGQPWWCPQSVATPSPWPWCRGLNVIYVLPFGKPLLGVWDKTHLQLGHCRTVPCHPSGGLGLPHPPGSLWGVGQQQGFSGHLYKRDQIFLRSGRGKPVKVLFLGKFLFPQQPDPPGSGFPAPPWNWTETGHSCRGRWCAGGHCSHSSVMQISPGFPTKMPEHILTKPSVYLRHL